MLCTMTTDHGTRLGVDADRAVSHRRGAHALVPLLAWRFPGEDRTVLLIAHDDGAIRLYGESAPGSILSYRAAAVDGRVTLQHPGTGLYMAAEPDGSVRVNRDRPSTWEQFSLAPVAAGSDGSRHRLVAELRAPEDPQEILRLARMPPSDDMESVAAALIRLHTAETLRTLVPALNHLPSYPHLFAPLRERLASEGSGSLRQFYANVIWGGPDCVTAGAHTYGSPRVLPYWPARLTIGRYCAIAQEVTIILGNDLTREASTYPYQAESRKWPTRSAEPPIADDVPRDVTIGSDVWIGYGATILAGTRIGDGCIIGANAVVRGHVPPYSIYGGNPGAVVRQRFDDGTVARLLKLQWWHWPDWKVDRHSARLMSGGIEAFLEIAERDGQG